MIADPTENELSNVENDLWENIEDSSAEWTNYYPSEEEQPPPATVDTLDTVYSTELFDGYFGETTLIQEAQSVTLTSMPTTETESSPVDASIFDSLIRTLTSFGTNTIIIIAGIALFALVLCCICMYCAFKARRRKRSYKAHSVEESSSFTATSSAASNMESSSSTRFHAYNATTLLAEGLGKGLT
jgi:hypothetical protein